MAFPWFDHNWTIDFIWSSEYTTRTIAPPLPSSYSPSQSLGTKSFDSVLVKDNQSNIVSTYLYAGYKSAQTQINPPRQQKFTESGTDVAVFWSGGGVSLREKNSLYLYSVNIPSSFIQDINNTPNINHTGQGTMDFQCEFYLMKTRGSKAIIINYLKQDGTTEQLMKRWLWVDYTLPTPTGLQCSLEWEGGTVSSDSDRHRLKIYHPQIQFTGTFHSAGAMRQRFP